MYILGVYLSDLVLNKICFLHFITMSQSTKRRWNSGPSTPSSTSKKKKYNYSRTSGKNHTIGYSQVRWEMIWHFALCEVPTSVLLQGDCMILRDTQRPVYTRKQSLLLTSDSVLRAAKKAVLTYQSNTSSCNQTVKLLIEGSIINLYTMNIECVFIYHFTSLLYNHSTTRYNFVHLKATRKISPLEELVGGRFPPSSSHRLTGMNTMKIVLFNK